MNGNGANVFAFICGCQRYIAHFVCRQHTIFICAVGDRVCNILWNICGVTGCAYACNIHSNRSAGRNVFCLNIKRHAIKCLRSNCRRDDNKTT